MAATATITQTVVVSGLGNEDNISLQFSPAAPTGEVHAVRQIINATTFTPAALDLGSVTAPLGIWLRAIDQPVDIDTSFNSTFSKEITVHIGQATYFVPLAGNTVYVQNNTTGQQPTYEYVVIG